MLILINKDDSIVSTKKKTSGFTREKMKRTLNNLTNSIKIPFKDEFMFLHTNRVHDKSESLKSEEYYSIIFFLNNT